MTERIGWARDIMEPFAARRMGAEYGKRITETDINSWGKQKRERGLNRKGQQ